MKTLRKSDECGDQERKAEKPHVSDETWGTLIQLDSLNLGHPPRDKMVYFYNSSEIIGKPMKVKGFLGK